MNSQCHHLTLLFDHRDQKVIEAKIKKGKTVPQVEIRFLVLITEAQSPPPFSKCMT